MLFANGIISFFFMAEQYSIVYMYHVFFVYSSVDGRLPLSFDQLNLLAFPHGAAGP